MGKFLGQDFILKSDAAKELYHKYAEQMPIVDYHCHIDPNEILEDRKYQTITEAWLGGDHYKWRAMRSNNVSEYYITGNAAPEEKFMKWAETVPNLVGNPLYHWAHLELQRYFGIDEPLSGKNAMDVYHRCNRLLASPEYSVRGIIKKSNVKVICSTDDPIDTLDAHQKIASDSTFDTAVLPAFRPDKAMRADKPEFSNYVKKLEAAVGYSISTMEQMRKALLDRIAYFDDRRCRISDHALDFCFCEAAGEAELDAILQKSKAGMEITQHEQMQYHTALLLAVGKEYCRRDWVMQLHFGCLRNASSKQYNRLGADTGFDSMNDASNAAGLASLLDTLDVANALPKTILYSLNPADNGVIGSIIGCFQTDAGIPGKIQQGSAWWFNDHKSGMEAQLTSLMNLGCIANFNGMLTDSRSFLSYTRHEYFRRILCNLFGQMAEDGEYPYDMKHLGKIVQDISYNNAVKYFRFNECMH
ncbi:MAG: glucuronate isomerase [Oscillospiraceae bacterium]|nr:glucuronate isomerase [Oscillospiraceae bacterium]